MIEVLHSAVGPYGTNCYIIKDGATGEAAAVDCAVFDGDYKNFLEKNGIEKLKYIILTHGHFDHVCGVAGLKNYAGGQVCIHEDDRLCLEDEKANLNSFSNFAEFTPCPADVILKDGDSLFLGDNEIKIMHTPGHTKGSVCLIVGEYIFSGDTLFRLSMGRTDLPGGSTKQLFASLEAIGKIEGEYTIFPGHGEFSALTEEKKYNRYLKQRQNF